MVLIVGGLTIALAVLAVRLGVGQPSEDTTLLAEIARVLKPGGALLVGVPGERGYASDEDHKRFYDERTLVGSLEAGGFQKRRVFHVPVRSRFLSRRVRQYCIYGVFGRQ